MDKIKEITDSKIDVKLSFVCTLKSDNYKIIKQENIITEYDNLVTGIYKTDSFDYIVCCNRGDKTLDYTKFAASEEQANILYNDMMKEIKEDLKK